MESKGDVLVNILITIGLVSVRILLFLCMVLIAVILAMFHAKND